ncbi:sulfite exporter TauE/SafE family protein [Acidihalobacter prosperus]|uniref:Probable membrane transporter protein n=1 Tax=Acidihalobacter prosperus TaxID=160660 RepID=A0A1A6C515_9GAMM|nr:sulfite exporter TauE/SafE family protein [Acidihalobacter prosperus]OBS09652.1 membrane protein [Acidihalobacter prosperus]
MLATLPLFLGLGVVAGLLAGMLGVGGGIVVVPVLLAAFAYLKVAPEMITHLAIGTSLATIVFTSLSAVRAQQRKKAIDWQLVRALAPAVVVGSFISGYVAGWIPGHWLRLTFGVFLILASIQLLLNWRPPGRRGLPAGPGLWAVGVAIGTVSALVGIGGGTLTVPFLSWCNVEMKRAVAASSALGFVLALFGAAGFVISGFGDPMLPSWSLGYVSLPALIGIMATAVLFAPLGVQLSHRLPVAVLKRIFGMLLLAVAVQILFFK